MQATSPALAGPGTARPAISLSGRLRRAERSRRWAAFLLVAPLLLYVMVLFVAPIGLVMVRAVYDSDLDRLAPRTAVVLEAWDGR